MVFRISAALRGAGVAALAFACLLPRLADAALTLSATRLVITDDKRSASLVVRNPGTSPYAAQVWVNTDTDDTTTQVPLMPAPGLFRLGPGQEQQVTVNRLPSDLPSDRESLFYFNLQEIPQKTEGPSNTLRIALRTRIKVFHRPSQFKGDPTLRLKELRWHREREQGRDYLVVDNPTPFHFSFVTLRAQSAGKTHALTVAPMVAPLSRQRYPVDIALGDDARLAVAAINDYGGFTDPLNLALPLAP
jgi:chaperone protein EcpD